MAERVSIAKAARLLGISRHDLSERLLRAGIETFEGSVDLDAVKGIAPRLKTDDAMISERVRLIRQTARRRQAVAPPRKSERELQDELDRMHNQWLVERRKAQEYNALFDEMLDELGRWQNSDDPGRAQFALDFSAWICKRFDE